ncbi:MAG: hypothetical protein Q9225_007707, partial [Loekoesia sp. 1 TL-2023]
GGLEINMNLPADDSELFKITTNEDDNWIMPADVMQELANQVAVAVGDRTTIHQVANELQTALKGTGKFVFPGAGIFLYKGPIFNNELDLLVETSYNGYVIKELPLHGQEELTVNTAERMTSLVAKSGVGLLQSDEVKTAIQLVEEGKWLMS